MNVKLKSHPDKLLIDHLSEVAKILKSVIEGKSFNFSLQFKGKELDLNAVIPNLAYIAGAFHDLGKATVFFQKYITNPEQLHDYKKSHALLSALFVYFSVKKYLIEHEFDDMIKQLLATFTFSAVKRHHGKLINLGDEILLDKENQDLLTEQVKAIEKNEISEIIQILLKDYDFSVNWDEFINFIVNKEYYDEFDDFSFDILDDEYKNIDKKIKLALFFIHQLIYSTLLFADKNDVILQEAQNPVAKSDILRKIAKYREDNNFNNPTTEINKLKNNAFFESAEYLEKIFDKNYHIYSVTLPTGIGKTITAFNLGDKIRKMAGFKDSKIIINIPFTSIIDQNFEVYADILQSKESNVLLKHHHLADPIYKTNENTADYNESKFLIETWQSDTVVTTFVQLLETLLTCDKAKLMKLPHLANSVILLDEIQTIPYEYWETIRESFKTLGERYNIYFILISATQPLIFTPDEDIRELIPDYKKYFDFFNRTKLIINKNILSFDEFKHSLTDYISENSQKDVLVILNTKDAARKTFQFVCNEIETENIETYFLTTLITPFERKKIINQIKQISNKQKIIISTQLVEAGVDISVDTVFRQIAPLDSIIQAAGRANRYSEKPNISEIHICDIEELSKASNMIYGSDLLIKTANVLKEFEVVEEKNYIELIEKYFQEVRKQSDQTTNKLLAAMRDLNFASVDFKLIDQRNTESVFVQLNEHAKEIWEQYVQIYQKEDLKPWDRKKLFSHIKAEFYDYVINVPIPWNEQSINFDSEKTCNFYVSDLENPSKNYSYSENDYTNNTGYNSENSLIML